MTAHETQTLLLALDGQLADGPGPRRGRTRGRAPVVALVVVLAGVLSIDGMGGPALGLIVLLATAAGVAWARGGDRRIR